MAKYPDLTNAYVSPREVLSADEIRYMARLFKDIAECDILDDATVKLVISIEEQMLNDGKLSKAQIETVEKIHKRANDAEFERDYIREYDENY